MQKLKALWKSFRANWMTNTGSVLMFLWTVPQFVTAFSDWAHHRPADWRMAIFGIFATTIAAVCKDSNNHSTIAQVEAATDKATPPQPLS